MQIEEIIIIKDTEYVQVICSCWKSGICCLFNIFHWDEFCFQSSYGWLLNLKTFKQIEHRFLKQ